MMASPPVFLSTLLSDLIRVELVKVFVGWTGVAFFLGVLAEELEAIYKISNNNVSDQSNKQQ